MSMVIITDKKTTSACGRAKETTAHMLHCSQLARPSTLDDLIVFNDTVKQCTELWKKKFDDAPMMMELNMMFRICEYCPQLFAAHVLLCGIVSA